MIICITLYQTPRYCSCHHMWWLAIGLDIESLILLWIKILTPKCIESSVLRSKKGLCATMLTPPHIFMYYLRGLKYWISWKALPQILLLPCSIAKRSFLGLFRWRCYLWWLDLEGRECLRRWQGSTWWKSGCTPIILFVLKCLITLITPIWLALTLDWDN